MTELTDNPAGRSPDRVRAPGGGRKKSEVANPELVDVLDGLIELETRGDPESPLRWTTKSTCHLAAELSGMVTPSATTSSRKFSIPFATAWQGTRKKLEGSQHPDRDDQFRYINKLAKEFLAAGDPVISVDTKKRNSSAGSPKPVKNGIRRVNRSTCPPTTSPVKPTAKQSPTESTI